MTETEKAIARLRQWKDGSAPDVTYCAGSDLFAKDTLTLLAALDTHVWRDISSAPKDGTSIIVGYDTKPPSVGIAAWPTHTNAKAGWCEGSKYGRKVYREPTHWMPLPSPPPAIVKETTP